MKQVLGSDDWRKKSGSNRRRPGVHTVRLRGQDVAEQLVNELMTSNEDLADEPDAMQIEDICEQFPGTSLETKKKMK